MNRTRFVLALLAGVITLLTPVLLALGSVRLLMTETYLRLEYHKPDFPPDDLPEGGFTLQDRLDYAPYAVRYLLEGAPDAYLADLRLPDGVPLFNEREISHMHDVQIVVRWAMAVLVGGVLVFAGVVIVLLRMGRPGRQALRLGLSRGAWIILIVLAALLVYILLDWDRFFTAFHNLFFAEGTWRFYYTDSLIRLFPIRFWQDAALTLGGLCATAAAALLIFCRVWARRDLVPDVPESS